MTAPTTRSDWRTRALTPVDIASLAAFRILFGSVMALSCVRLLTSGWIEIMYLRPSWFFRYAGLEVPPWPGVGMYVHYAVLGLLGVAIAVGFYFRVAIVLFLVGFLYTQLIDVTNYLNHHYLVVLLGGLLACLPAHAAWSLDARRSPALRRTWVPAWMVWLLRFQIGVVYVFAGLAKLKVDWLLHGQPLHLWLMARTDTPLVGPMLARSEVAFAMSWAGFLFDTTIAGWLSWTRTRLPAFACVLLFHGATGYLFNIGMFPVIMTTSALIFFSPSWPRHLLRRPAVELPTTLPPPPARPIRALIALHVVVQIALPLRHHAYPGSVLWNEDGMRFAWHVLIREKHGSVTFIARFASGKQLEVPPSNYLTPRQEREMAGQPDLILQMARHIGRDLRARGYRDFTLHADTAVSLNGRTPVPLIDPAANLLGSDTTFTTRGP